MDSTNFRKIEAHLNAERLNAYRKDGADDETTLARYLLNMALCEALYGPLQMAEVTLRNRVFHHERILHWRDLEAQHLQILQLIGWINPELEALTWMLDRFSETRSLGLSPWREKLSAL